MVVGMKMGGGGRKWVVEAEDGQRKQKKASRGRKWVEET